MGRLTTATYVKIVMVALLCLVLCGGIAGCVMMPWQFGNAFRSAWNEDYSEQGSFEVQASQVHDIRIDWLAGQVDVLIEDDPAVDVLTAVEEFDRPSFDDQRMGWQLQNGTLRIGYGMPSGGLFGCMNTSTKHLTLTIPRTTAEQLGTFGISAASGTYTLGAIGCDRLELDLASGRMAGHGITAQNLKLNVASGEVNLAGAFSESAELEIASGRMEIACLQVCPKRCDISVASGNVTMRLPKSSGLTAQVEKLSGSFTCDLPDAHMRIQDNAYIYGDGASAFNIEMASGDVRLTTD